MKSKVIVPVAGVLGILVISSLALFSQQVEKKQAEILSYSIEVPVNWAKSEQHNTQGESAKGEPYTLYVSPKDKNGEQISIIVITSPYKGKDLEHYVKSLLNSYSQKYGEFEMTNKEEFLLSDLFFASFDIAHKYKGIDFVTRTVFTMKEGIVYQVNAVAPVKRFETSEPQIREIIGTFRLIEKK